MIDSTNFAEQFRVLLQGGKYDKALDLIEFAEEDTLYLLWNHPDLPRDIKVTGRPLAQAIDEDSWQQLSEKLHHRYRWSQLLMYPILSILSFVGLVFFAISSFNDGDSFGAFVGLFLAGCFFVIGIMLLRVGILVRQQMKSATKKK